MRHCFGEFLVRDWCMDDASSITRYANNRKIWNNLRDAFPYPYCEEDAVSYISGALRTEPRVAYAIATKSVAIGSIGLMPGKDVHRFSAELGYWLAEPFWGRGIMTEAVKAVSEYGLETLGFSRIYAEPYATNPASARVLEKSGFALEGIMCASVFKDGQVLDQFLYAKVKSEIRLRNHSARQNSLEPIRADSFSKPFPRADCMSLQI
ncbi:MAG: N-acetyltransferase [Methanothrix sp.]|nr:MAG: N-acetyltransferase [Methanothrix sp.]